jgi:hypothetical protein
LNRKAKITILIRTDDGKTQQFTLEGNVENPDIRLGAVVYEIERAINEHTRYRAHAAIEEPDA